MASRARNLRGAAMAVALLAVAPTHPLLAQHTNGIQVFSADYFAASRPADAYDMVRKLPGFELIDVDEDVRGFAGSRGNVLFDGRPPSGKQETLEEMLRRIPAASVLRIELIRGGGQSAATGGYDQVANVVRRTITATSSSLLSGVSVADTIGVKPDLRFELSRQSGERRLDGSAALETDIDDDSGKGTIVERDAGGAELDREERDEREVKRTLSADAEYKLPLGPGELVANLSASRDRTLETIRTGSQGETSLATERERLWSGEGGAQYRTELNGGELQAVAVHRFGRLRLRAEEENEAFAEATRTSESIGRAEYRWGGDELRLFGTAEAALNQLSSDARLTVGGTEVPLAGSDVEVRERRAEAGFGAVWKASPSWTIEPSIRAEVSNIRSTGDSPQDEAFLFWKPRFRASWSDGGTRVQATVEREAAQLDFGDFVASAELDRDIVVAGAESLRPPTTWSASSSIEQRFWGDGVILLSFRREWIDDVIDRVLLERDGDLFDAVGNIGSGKRRIVRVELTAPFQKLGIPGLQLRAALTFLKSRVTDPVTRELRAISEDRPFEADIRLTHDLPGGRWSWGADSSLAHHEHVFRFDEVREERKGMSFGAFVEFRPAAQWRMRAEVENLSSRHLVEDRRKYDGPRSTGELDEVETRRLRTSPIVKLSVRRAFGAAKHD